MAEIDPTSSPQQDPEHETRVKIFKYEQVLWFVIGTIISLLGLRFIFRLVAVNPENLFAAFLYNLTDLFLFPFADIASEPQAGGMVFEVSTLIAMLVYGMFGWALERLIYILFYKPRG